MIIAGLFDWLPWRKPPPDPTPFIYNLCASIFIVFCIAIAVALALPYVHSSPHFQRIKAAMRIPALCVAVASLIYGLVLAARGWGASGLQGIDFFRGAVAFAFAGGLAAWARANDQKQQTSYAKVVSLSVGFFIALSFLMTRAKDLFRF